MEIKKNEISPGTLAFYKKIIDAHLIPTYGKMHLDEFRVRHVQDYIQFVIAKGRQDLHNPGSPMSAGTVKRYATVFRSILSLAYKEILMKRIISFMVALLMLIMLVSCNETTSPTDTSKVPGETINPSDTEPPGQPNNQGENENPGETTKPGETTESLPSGPIQPVTNETLGFTRYQIDGGYYVSEDKYETLQNFVNGLTFDGEQYSLEGHPMFDKYFHLFPTEKENNGDCLKQWFDYNEDDLISCHHYEKYEIAAPENIMKITIYYTYDQAGHLTGINGTVGGGGIIDHLVVKDLTFDFKVYSCDSDHTVQEFSCDLPNLQWEEEYAKKANLVKKTAIFSHCF